MKRVLLVVLAASCLSACGLKGDLERPPPLWGDPAPQAPAEPPPSDDAGEQETPTAQ